MKKLVLFFVIIFTLDVASATEISVSPKMTEVTVYLQGASINSIAETKIPVGVSCIKLTDLPTMINEESIQIEGIGNFSINNVSYAITNDKSPKGDSLAQIQKKLNAKIASLQYTKDVYSNEIDLLNANKEIKGTNSNLNVVELEKVMKFYQSQMLDLKSKIYETEKSLTEAKEELKKINNELSFYKNKNKGEITVFVSTTKAQNIQLGLSYYVDCAWWTPFYEVRVEEVNKDISVTYKAKVFQNSGFDWNDVKVILSTGNPTLNGTVPTLSKWILREQQPQVRYSSARMEKSMVIAYDSMEIEEDYEMEAPAANKLSKATKLKTTTNEKMTSIEFAVDELFSVKSQQNDAMLTINENKLPANYVYRCVPKLDKHAYLLAKITDFSKYNFLSGDASLYLSGKYVGTSYLNIYQTTDTLQFSLGQDNGIVVERNLSDDFNKKSSVGKNYKQNVSWTISARNNKSTDVQLEIQDNLPVAGSSDITVSNQSYNGATINDKNIATWTLHLKPAETQSVKLSYTVTYPKIMSLNIK
ncbi:MAG: DUF4139 domain-containing protein [Bacteroidales bacterium]|nr:DUF4139 domain-containing protein [Bacteroidales bacterium]